MNDNNDVIEINEAVVSAALSVLGRKRKDHAILLEAENAVRAVLPEVSKLSNLKALVAAAEQRAAAAEQKSAERVGAAEARIAEAERNAQEIVERFAAERETLLAELDGLRAEVARVRVELEGVQAAHAEFLDRVGVR